jgi:5-methylcytosine-specific restriction endonuclease McrA
MIGRRKTIGRRGFKVDLQATFEFQGTGRFKDNRSFIDVHGHELLYGEDMSNRRIAIFSRDRGRCMLLLSPRCRGWVSFANAEVDHIIPRGKLGSDDADNLRLCCGLCHRMRHVRPQWTKREQAKKDFNELYKEQAT